MIGVVVLSRAISVLLHRARYVQFAPPLVWQAPRQPAGPVGLEGLPPYHPDQPPEVFLASEVARGVPL
eukprot:1606027-Alexandrium_andersonii.AAC.1